LAFSLDLPDTSLGRDTLALAERSDLGGMSFAFVPVDEHWDGDRRELQSVDLREISVVSAWPAYEATEVVARSRETRHPIASVARRFIESL
jgi:Escherichia/Staphylococcus phage prohead protease